MLPDNPILIPGTKSRTKKSERHLVLGIGVEGFIWVLNRPKTRKNRFFRVFNLELGPWY